VIQFWWRSGSRFGSGSPKSEIWIPRIGGGLCSLSAFLVVYTKTIDMSQMTPTDPRDEFPHAQSPIALYTELDAECDQQAAIVGRLLTAGGDVYRHQARVVNNRLQADVVFRILRQWVCHDQIFYFQSLEQSSRWIGSTRETPEFP